MGRAWRIGLVGVGRGSAYGNLVHRHPRTVIAALCDIAEDALARHQEELGLPDHRCFTDYGAFIGSGLMDAVILGTPIPYHAEQAVQALDSGVHVFSEVTAADTIEGCSRIVEAARRSGAFYMLAENTIYRPLFADWRSLLRSGRLGEIFYAEADYLHPIPYLLAHPQTREHRWRAARPPVTYCSHSLGPLLHLTQDRVVRAMAVGDGHRILPDVPIGGVDIQLAVFATERRAIIKMTRTQVAPRHPPIHYYHLQGTGGFIETDRLGVEPDRRVQRGVFYLEDEMTQAQSVEWPEVDESLPDYATLGGHGTCDYATFLAFLDALDNGRRPALDETWAWNLTVPGLVAAESAAKGGVWLDVPPSPS